MEKCDLKDARTAIRNPQSVTVFESIELEKMKKEIEEIRGKQAEARARYNSTILTSSRGTLSSTFTLTIKGINPNSFAFRSIFF